MTNQEETPSALPESKVQNKDTAQFVGFQSNVRRGYRDFDRSGAPRRPVVLIEIASEQRLGYAHAHSTLDRSRSEGEVKHGDSHLPIQRRPRC